MLFLGCDVGGTKTLAVLANEKGEVLSYWKGKGANYQTVGKEKALSNLREVINGVLDRAGKTVSDVDFAFFGYAGADFEHEFQIVRSILDQLGFERYDFDNDGRIALRSGTFDDVGIVISCGTGSISYASDGKKINRIGGLSFFFGERLGSYHIAGLVASAVVRAKDGRGEKTLLVEEVEKEVGPLEKLMRYEYEGSPEMEELVRLLIEKLFSCAKKGDFVALKILHEIAEEVLRIVQAHRKVLALLSPVKVVLEGGFFKNADEILRKMIGSALGSECVLVIPEHDPVVGAVLLAMERAGLRVERDVVETLVKTYLERVRA